MGAAILIKKLLSKFKKTDPFARIDKEPGKMEVALKSLAIGAVTGAVFAAPLYLLPIGAFLSAPAWSLTITLGISAIVASNTITALAGRVRGFNWKPATAGALLAMLPAVPAIVDIVTPPASSPADTTHISASFNEKQGPGQAHLTSEPALSGPSEKIIRKQAAYV